MPNVWKSYRLQHTLLYLEYLIDLLENGVRKELDKLVLESNITLDDLAARDFANMGMALSQLLVASHNPIEALQAVTSNFPLAASALVCRTLLPVNCTG